MPPATSATSRPEGPNSSIRGKGRGADCPRTQAPAPNATQPSLLFRRLGKGMRNREVGASSDSEAHPLDRG